MKYQAIIFDFNGVLLWDAKWHEEAWNKTALELRGRKFTKQEVDQHLHGRTNREILSYLLGRKVRPAELTKYRNKKEKLYQKIALSKGKKFTLAPGATKLLDLLIKHKIKRTIATSSPLMNVHFYFKHLKLRRWFDIKKITYDLANTPSKPAPDIYLKAAKKIKVPIKQCIILEDSKVGVQSGKNAKAGKVIVVTGNNDTKGIKADKRVRDLKQITLTDFK